MELTEPSPVARRHVVESGQNEIAPGVRFQDGVLDSDLVEQVSPRKRVIILSARFDGLAHDPAECKWIRVQILPTLTGFSLHWEADRMLEDVDTVEVDPKMMVLDGK